MRKQLQTKTYCFPLQAFVTAAASEGPCVVIRVAIREVIRPDPCTSRGRSLPLLPRRAARGLDSRALFLTCGLGSSANTRDTPQLRVRCRAIPRRRGGRWRRAAVACPKDDLLMAMVAV